MGEVIPMLKEIIKKIDSAIPSLFPVNAEQFNDPVALRTEWKGIRVKSGGPSTLVIEVENRLFYKPSIIGYVFGVVFILAGLFIFGLYFIFSSEMPWFLMLVGLAFALAGVAALFQASTPVVFDKTLGLFYKGRKQKKMPDTNDAKHSLSFSEIHAIQLLTRLEQITDSAGDKNSIRRTRYYRVYEMNLVKHDGERMYVTTYNKDEKARHDARTIADFIGVPIWDGIDG